MVCPKCGGRAIVKNTLHSEDNETYRKIKCADTPGCGHIFYTIEYEVEYNRQLKEDLSKCERMIREEKRLRKLADERMGNDGH